MAFVHTQEMATLYDPWPAPLPGFDQGGCQGNTTQQQEAGKEADTANEASSRPGEVWP